MSRTRMAIVMGLAAAGVVVSSGCAKPKWSLGVMTYTFREFTLLEAIDKTKALGMDCVEGFTWQKVSPEHPDVNFDPAAPDEVLKAVKCKLEQTDVKMLTCYAHLGKSEEQDRKLFAFANEMGIKAFVCEPPEDTLERLDKLAAEYGVNVAIHNHPKDPAQPEYTNWDPDKVVEMLEGYSKRIGTCADVGHWVRSGVDPVEALRKYQGRLISVHVKDIEKPERKSRDVPWGAGIANARAIMTELDRQGFSGVFAIEYEHNPKDNMADVAQCAEFFNQVAAELGR